jgi:carboxyl-terminal processing protease
LNVSLTCAVLWRDPETVWTTPEQLDKSCSWQRKLLADAGKKGIFRQTRTQVRATILKLKNMSLTSLRPWAALVVLLLSWNILAEETPKIAKVATGEDPVRDLILFSSRYTNVVPLKPSEYDQSIAPITVHLLERSHYLRQPLDAAMAHRFLQSYFESLDPMHIHFMQPDIQEFEKFQDRLPELTMEKGDTRLARDIFARFLQRVDQRVEFVAGLLQEGGWDFAREDRYQPNRKDLPWPADVTEARALWQQHLRHEYLLEKLNKKTPAQIVKTLSARYKRLLRSWGELDSDEVLEVYLTALARSYDPHSDYMGKSQLDNFVINMNLALFGIGALLRSEDGNCKIESLVPGGPAARSKKVKPGDKIIAVAQKEGDPVDVVDMKLPKVVQMIRGPKGSEVSLTIVPADASDDSQRKTVVLVRDEIKLEDSEAKAKLYEMHGQSNQPLRIGVIDLPSFYANFDLGGKRERTEPRSTSIDVARLLKKLIDEKASGIVLDLRRNGGGSLEEAIRLTGLFIKQGPIVQVKDTSGEVNVEYDPDPTVLYDGPLVVLTSRLSASASEILAAALQDYGRALVVGDTNTHGKGTVQTIYELNRIPNAFPSNVNPGALKFTIRKFYRTTGSSTQRKGVMPDIVLPSITSHLDIGESSLDNALLWDTIAPAKFEPVDRVRASLPELKRRTATRQESDKDFAYIREDIQQYLKGMADKTISLNEAVRLKEKEETDLRLKSRKEERKSRHDPKDVFFEISLKDVAKPGLPEPGPHKKTEEEQAAKAKPSDDTLSSEEPVEEEETTPLDPVLDETRRIMVDYILLHGAKPSTPAVARQ